MLNRVKYQKHTVETLVSRLVISCILTISLNCYAAPPVTDNTCKSRWTLTNITTGMQFGDFTIESGSGTIQLNGGFARINGGTVDLVNAGSAVNSHQISLENSLGTGACAALGIELNWVTDPATVPMTGAGNNITMSNVLVNIPGEPGTPFTLPHLFIPASSSALPISMEVISTMNTSSPQTNGLYTSVAYEIGVLQSKTNTTTTGIAEAFSITALTLTPGVNMDFGQVASGSAGGSIILNEISGARSVGSGDVDVISDAIAGTPGTFTIQGDAGLSFNISYVNGMLTDSAGANAMTISGFTDTAAALTLTGGLDTFSVGGTLNLNAFQQAGNYSTANPGGVPYSITVNYN